MLINLVCNCFIKMDWINCLGLRLVNFFVKGNKINCLMSIVVNCVVFFGKGVNKGWVWLLKKLWGWGLKLIIVGCKRCFIVWVKFII